MFRVVGWDCMGFLLLGLGRGRFAGWIGFRRVSMDVVFVWFSLCFGLVGFAGSALCF